MSAYTLEKTKIPKRKLPFPPPKIWPIRFDLPKTQKIDRPGWIPSEITDNWDTSPYAYQTEEEMMPQGGPHGQLSSYLSELLRAYLEPKNLMLLIDSFMLYRDKSGIKQRIGPDLLLMPLQKPAPSSYDLDVVPPPGCLVEITSPESHDKDLDQNLSLYASLGIKTYLVIDLMVPHQNKVRKQIQLHVFQLTKGKFVEKNPDHEGYLALPEMGLKIKAEGQQIVLVDKLTGEVLLDVTELKEALESEVEKAKEAKQQAFEEKQRANVAEQQAKAQAERANAAEQQAETEAKRAKVETKRAKVAFSDGEQKGRLAEKQETARKMLAKGFNLADIAELTDLSIDELAILSKK